MHFANIVHDDQLDVDEALMISIDVVHFAVPILYVVIVPYVILADHDVSCVSLFHGFSVCTLFAFMLMMLMLLFHSDLLLLTVRLLLLELALLRLHLFVDAPSRCTLSV